MTMLGELCIYGEFTWLLIEHNDLPLLDITNRSWRYIGTLPCITLYLISKILYSTHSGNWSQWRSIKTGVMWSYFFGRVIIQAAAFGTCCNLSNCSLGMLYGNVLNISNLNETKVCTMLATDAISRFGLLRPISFKLYHAPLHVYPTCYSIDSTESKMVPIFLAELLVTIISDATLRDSFWLCIQGHHVLHFTIYCLTGSSLTNPQQGKR